MWFCIPVTVNLIYKQQISKYTVPIQKKVIKTKLAENRKQGIGHMFTRISFATCVPQTHLRDAFVLGNIQYIYTHTCIYKKKYIQKFNIPRVSQVLTVCSTYSIIFFYYE